MRRPIRNSVHYRSTAWHWRHEAPDKEQCSLPISCLALTSWGARQGTVFTTDQLPGTDVMRRPTRNSVHYRSAVWHWRHEAPDKEQWSLPINCLALTSWGARQGTVVTTDQLPGTDVMRRPIRNSGHYRSTSWHWRHEAPDKEQWSLKINCLALTSWGARQGKVVTSDQLPGTDVMRRPTRNSGHYRSTAWPWRHEAPDKEQWSLPINCLALTPHVNLPVNRYRSCSCYIR